MLRCKNRQNTVWCNITTPSLSPLTCFNLSLFYCGFWGCIILCGLLYMQFASLYFSPLSMLFHSSSFHPLHPHPSLLSCVSYFFNLLSSQFVTAVCSVVYLQPLLPSPPVFHVCRLSLFLSVFLRFSIAIFPSLIPLADPQRERREWVGLKRERNAVLYPARSSLARLKCSEENK